MNRLVFARGWGWGAAAVVIKAEHGEAWYSNTLIVVAITGDRTPSAIRTHTRPRAHGKPVQSERALSTVCASVSWCRYCRLVNTQRCHRWWELAEECVGPPCASLRPPVAP